MRIKSIKYSDIEQYPTYFKLQKNVKENFFGTSPAPFIGRYGYPNVNVGLLSPQETTHDAWLYDAPKHWAQKLFSIPKIVDLRMSLVNSRTKAPIKAKRKITQIAQEIGLSKNPIDIEVGLTKKPTVRPLNDRIVMPMGPTGQIKKARITQNPKMDRFVEKVHYDTDLKALDAITYLYKKSHDEHTLSRILSVGSLGVGKNRKLVPTRWSITAVDDTIGKKLIEQIKDFSESDYVMYYGSFLGNHFIILLLSDVWSFELFEMYMPKTNTNKDNDLKFSTDHEFYSGRKNYAQNCAGGYYASRLPIVEKLKKMKRQSSLLVLRFVTDDYHIPLGVWVVREAVRKALSNKGTLFESKKAMLDSARMFVKNNFGFDVDLLLKKSKILAHQKIQKKLTSFLK